MKKKCLAVAMCLLVFLGARPFEAPAENLAAAGEIVMESGSESVKKSLTDQSGGKESEPEDTGEEGSSDQGSNSQNEETGTPGSDGESQVPGEEGQESGEEEKKGPPTVSVSFGDKPSAVSAGRTYYRGARTAVITVTDPDEEFEEEIALEGLQIRAKDWSGEEIPQNVEEMVSEWTAEEDGSYRAEITFSKEGIYTWSYSYTNAEGLSGEAVSEDAYAFSFTIDKTAPRAEIAFDQNTPRRIIDGRGYFGVMRTATVTVTDQAGEFDPDAASQAIRAGIRAADANGKGIRLSDAELSGAWESVPGDAPGEEKHQIRVAFSEDANYTFAFHYTDRAGNESGEADTGNSVAVRAFTVDRGAPSGTLQAVGAEKWEKTWTRLMDTLSYGLYSRKEIRIRAKGTDAISPVESVQYLRADAGTALTAQEAEAAGGWNDFEDFSVTDDGQFQIVLKVTDLCGNVTYISSDRMTVDKKRPQWETLAPRMDASLTRPENGIYRDDVTIDVEASDPQMNNAYSGLARVWYEVQTDGETTQSADLYVSGTEPVAGQSQENGMSEPARGKTVSIQSQEQASPRQSWTGTITVSSRKNNSNHVRVLVCASDRAGNVSKEDLSLKIDITRPVVEVEYDNNSPQNGSYYNRSRTATITVRERNFRAEDVDAVLTGPEGKVPLISEWQTIAGTGNRDDTVHTAQIRFEEDGEYTFDISCRDLAGNRSGRTDYRAGTATPQRFTIDCTQPDISVRYDNNRAENEKYFSAGRRAVVTVKERNFDISGAHLVLTVSLDGETVKNPVPEWSHDGDLHTAVIVCDQDGDYTFDVTAEDLAGNLCSGADYGSSAAPQAFTVDTHIAQPEVSGVQDGRFYRDEAGFEVHFEDRNLEGKTLRLMHSGRSGQNVDVSGRFVQTSASEDGKAEDAAAVIGKKPENDGIYTLHAEAWDKAGNHGIQTVTFTVNRFGSFYVFGKNMLSLNGQYVRRVTDDLFLTEYNPNRLVEGSLNVQITCDAATMEGVDYTVTPAAHDDVLPGEGGWYRYDYRIRSSNFSQDGVYRVVVSSEDKAGNHPETTNYKDGDVTFYVDSTAPEISWIGGMEESEVNAESREVEFEIFDAMGIKKTDVYVNGRRVSVKDQAGEPSVFRGAVRLSEGKNQTVRLVAEDFAGNLADSGAKDFHPGFDYEDRVTVSANIPARLYTHRRTVAGALCAAAGGAGILLAALRKRRRR